VLGIGGLLLAYILLNCESCRLPAKPKTELPLLKSRSSEIRTLRDSNNVEALGFSPDGRYGRIKVDGKVNVT
jgi:hypothetical protein